MTSESKNCPRCQRPLGASAPKGLCSHCLVSALLDMPEEDLPLEVPETPAPADVMERLGNYELIRQVGRGGMGVVFLARDLRLHRQVALKLILSGKLASQLEIKRFLAEGEASARLDHPGIVPIYEIGSSEGRHFLVMKWVEGGTLASRLDAGPAMPPREAVAFMAKVARAVHHAHQRGVLHRDIKPGNILVESDGEPWVTDFGLARRMDDPSELTLTGSVVGSPSYMAPEQAAGKNHEVTVATDVYSLGAVLYHVLAGRPPFVGDSVIETLRAVVEKDPPPLTLLNPGLDRDLGTLCMKALSKEPGARYASALELAQDMESWLRGEPIRARPVGPAGQLKRWVRRHQAISLLLALGVLGASFFVGMLIYSGQQLRRERDHARQMELKAEANADQALREARRAETNALEARLNLYSVDIHAAANFVDSGQVGPALELLKQHVPKPGSPDLRGFEWGLLARWCAQDAARVIRGHTRPVETLAVSPDGHWLASGDSSDIFVWSLPDLEKVSVVPDRLHLSQMDEKMVQGVNAIRKNPGLGVRLALGGGSLESIIARSRPDKAHATCGLKFSQDSTRLASAGREEFVKVWDVKQRVLTAWQETSNADLGWLPGGELLVLESQPRSYQSARILNAETGEVMSETEFHSLRLVFSNDRKSLCSLEPGGELVRRDLNHFRPLGRLKLSAPRADRLACSWTGNAVAFVALEDVQTLEMRSFDAPDRVTRTARLSSPILSVAFAPDGKRVACGLRDSSVMIFESDTGRELHRYLGHQAEVLSVDWTATGELVSGDKDGTVRVWKADTAPRVDSVPGRYSSVVVAARQPWIAGGLVRGGIQVFEPGGSLVCVLADSEGFQSVSFQNDDTVLLGLSPLSSGVSVLRRWSLPSGQVLESKEISLEDEATVRGFASSMGDQMVLMGGFDATRVSISHPDRGERLNQGQVGISGVRGMLPGGRFAARVRSGGILIWDVETGRRLSRLMHPDTWGSESLAGTPDGVHLISGDSDNAIRIWDIASGKLVRTLLGHISPPKSLAVSPDGRTLVSVGADGGGRLWSLSTGRELMSFTRGQAYSQLAFVPQGDRLVGLTHAGQLRIWDARAR